MVKTKEFFKENINKGYSFNHKISDREYWDGLKGEFYETVLEYYNGLDKTIPFLPVSGFMEYRRSGRLELYEVPYHKRRSLLYCTMLLEAIENKGERFNDILDLLFAILEETQWTPCSHNRYSKSNDIIPHEEDFGALDIFSGETAAMVSAVYFVLKDKIDAVSPEFGNRIRRKIKKEIFENFLNNDYYWMGFGRIPNNWNPWCVSNVLLSLVNLEKFDEFEFEVLARCTFILNKYVEYYPEDGGCDEGAGYWSHGAGNLILCAHLFKNLTNGRLNLFEIPAVKNTSDFLINTFVTNSDKLGFSDLGIKEHTEWEIWYKAGIWTGNEELIKAAKCIYEQEGKLKLITWEQCSFDRNIYMGEALRDFKKFESNLNLPLFSAYKSIGLMIARETKNPEKGLILSMKANHNNESHNHLDTGNIIVYKDEKPFIIDLGAKSYTAKTFSAERYTIWHTQSKYHNLPIIGGCEEKPGREFEATNLEIKDDYMKASLENAYGESFIKSYIREVKLEREKSLIVLADKISLTEEKEIEFSFMTNAEVENKDKIIINNAGTILEIIPDFDFEFSTEPIKDDDIAITNTWGETLKRISLKTKAKEKEFKFTIK